MSNIQDKNVTRYNIPHSHTCLELSIATVGNIDLPTLINYLIKYQFALHLCNHFYFLEPLKLIGKHVNNKLIIWNSFCLFQLDAQLTDLRQK